MATKYDYNRPLNIDDAKDVETAIWFSIVNYMHHQLGWSLEACKDRLQKELSRKIPADTFDYLHEVYQWNLQNTTVLDVGAGQGGGVLEALNRGADAYGIEPGDEFCGIGKMRLADANYDDSRMLLAEGEQIPFPENHFDYIVSLQVLEHVKNPKTIIKEIYRVLKPGGQCFIACENYLSFREQHYRVPWLPLLPKTLGDKYLKAIGRNPHFLKNYVYYTTYPQIWRISHETGFENITYEGMIASRKKRKKKNLKDKIINQVTNIAGSPGVLTIIGMLHLISMFRVGVRVVLRKKSEAI